MATNRCTQGPVAAYKRTYTYIKTDSFTISFSPSQLGTTQALSNAPSGWGESGDRPNTYVPTVKIMTQN